jgi:aspartyl-tRNA(Asn)/glutamyl-tRNA(Gln) amidotransferase subunit A
MALHDLSAKALSANFLSGEISAKQIVEHFLKRIGEVDRQIGAFLAICFERARHQAELLDGKRASGMPIGRLAAVPIAIKDNIHVLGEKTTCASRFLRNFHAPFNATVVSLLEAEGAIIIGKTNMDEFAMGSSTASSSFGPTVNPWDSDCSPGGSSGGSAAAVAARLVPIALGSDTGGSIRQPAAFCGVVGFKPTYGRVSRHGLVALASSLDQIGPLVRSSADAALVMEVIGRHCSCDPTSLLLPPEPYVSALSRAVSGLTIGVPREFLEGLAPDLHSHFNRALEVFKDLGVRIVDVNLSLLKYSVAAYNIIVSTEALTNLARFDGVRYGARSPRAHSRSELYSLSRGEGFGMEVKCRLMLGAWLLLSEPQKGYCQQAYKVRRLLIDCFGTAFASCDLIAMPTAPTAPFVSGESSDPLISHLADLYTIGANLAGLPAISTPSGFTSDGIPLGIQLIAPQCQDARLLCAADAFENAAGYHLQGPSPHLPRSSL